MTSRSSFYIFLLALLFVLSLSIILFELALTRIFSIVLWYDYAFMAISIAFFGLGIGSFMVHIQKDKFNTLKKKSIINSEFTFSSRIVRYAIAYGISMPIFILSISYIPSDTSYIYLFYLVSSVPFFFAGAAMALIFLAMSEKISKLYFADLIGAALATIILDPVMQSLGAGSALLLISAVVVGSSACGYFFMSKRTIIAIPQRGEQEETSYPNLRPNAEIDRKEVVVKPHKTLNVLAAITFSSLMILLIVSSASSTNIFEIKPGMSKGLYYQLNHPSEFQHLSEEWNSFSRVDVTRKIGKQGGDNNNILNSTLSIAGSKQNNNNNSDNSSNGISNNSSVTVADIDNATSHELASIIIDADAATPIYRWNGSQSDIAWIQKYMDYLPYEMINANNTLVIGSGGGEDILVALSGGADNVTAVELNPLVVSAVKHFDDQSGNIYNNNNVELIIDDGRRFISSSTEKYDVIVLKLVDSWAAQLAGGYALSENYLYTVEAFQQYFRHLDKDNGGMLVMTRWNFELPRLMPLIADSLVKETGKSRESVAKHVMVIEDRPGLYFGRSDDNQKYYPILVMVKSTPFLDGEVAMVKERAEVNQAEITMLADNYVSAPFNKLFNSDSTVYSEYFSTTVASNPTIPTDDSPFYFAREQIPRQMIILLITVVAISGLLSVLLIYHARKTRVKFYSRSYFHVLFAIFIGIGFMILEVTFIQKFLLLLGTPIMALTVILFTILLSSGIGSYISGKVFSTRPHMAVLSSIPILAGIIVIYFLYLQQIIESSISMELPYRIALTFVLLFPAGFLMGFQFPSLIKMASLIALQNKNKVVVFQYDNYLDSKNNNTTLLWGINIVASVIGTVLAAISAMVIGFNGNLLIGLCMYLGAGACALFSIYHMMNNNRTTTISIGGNL
jgi:predicted membrane-bound spermidine synthase